MNDNPTNPNLTSFGQGSNIPNNSPVHIPEVGNSSQLGTAQPCELTYDQLRAICPITQNFARAIGLILEIETLSYFPKRNQTTPMGIMVSIVEELVLATLEELADFEENTEKP